MKVIMFMAITANGLITGEKSGVSWISKKSWQGYVSAVRKAGNAVVGSRTYGVMPAEEFQKGCVYVVVTSRKSLKKKSLTVVFARSPKEALKILEKKGFRNIMVCGGGKLNASFMKENLVDEIYLDVEPIVLGKGIKLFADADFEAKLKLVGIKKLSRNEIQLHYKVVK